MTNKINSETIKKAAKIARLNLTENEIKKYQKDVKNILDAFKIISEVPDKIEPSFQPIEIKDVTRKDEPENCLTNEKSLANTKHKERGYFKGPSCLNNEI